MKQRLLILGITVMLQSPARGQLVSVKCCTTAGDLSRIGECLSGPSETEAPAECRSPGTCVLGFGEDVGLATTLCAVDQPQIVDPPRAYCSAWAEEGVEVGYSCIAKETFGVTLFSSWDQDSDGDFDLRDLAFFLQMYESVPAQVQSEGRIVYSECCFSQIGLLEIGDCLSGPGIQDVPAACEAFPTCIIGFSDPVGPSDYMYRLCDAVLTEPPDQTGALCSFWSDDDIPIAQLCRAGVVYGVTFFNVFDDDGDEDLDLVDFAAFQRQFEVAELP